MSKGPSIHYSLPEWWKKINWNTDKFLQKGSSTHRRTDDPKSKLNQSWMLIFCSLPCLVLVAQLPLVQHWVCWYQQVAPATTSWHDTLGYTVPPSPALPSSPGCSQTVESSLFNVTEFSGSPKLIHRAPHIYKFRVCSLAGGTSVSISITKLPKWVCLMGFGGVLSLVIWPNREADLLLTSQGSCQRSTGVLVGTAVFWRRTCPCMPSA